jgi:hypothetical protein
MAEIETRTALLGGMAGLLFLYFDALLNSVRRVEITGF